MTTSEKRAVRELVIRPGLMVMLSVVTRGGRSYDSTTTDVEREGQRETAQIQTTRTVEDVREFEAARKLQGEIRRTIAAECAGTSFGLICPEDNRADLETAIENARSMVLQHNASAQWTKIRLRLLTGRIEGDNSQAMRSVADEIAAVVGEMREAVAALDDKGIKSAVARANRLASLLTDEDRAPAIAAIEAVRNAGSEIRKAAKSGEDAARTIATVRATIGATLDVAEQRFLDYADAVQIAPLPSVDLEAAASIEVPDVQDDPAPVPAAPATEDVEIDTTPATASDPGTSATGADAFDLFDL